MSQANSKAAPVAAPKAAPISQTPVPQVESHAPEQAAPAADESSAARAVGALGVSSPHTTAAGYGALLDQLHGAHAMQGAVLKQLQRSHGNGFVGQVIQRKVKEQQPAVQRAARAANRDASQAQSDDELGRRIENAAGNGHALEHDARQKLEHGLGANLSQIRVHTDGEADRLARAVSANAFTTGRDIFFREGAYNPKTSDGMQLLAHEATHTLQQSSGPVAGKQASGGVTISDPSDKFEQAAESAADSFMRSSKASPQPQPQASTSLASRHIQRQPAPQPAPQSAPQQTPAQPDASADNKPETPGLDKEPQDVALGVVTPELKPEDIPPLMPYMEKLNSFLAVVKTDLELWREWREVLEEEPPGASSCGEAYRLIREIPDPIDAPPPPAPQAPKDKDPNQPWSVDPIGVFKGSVDHRVQSVLTSGLSAEDLVMLVQMMSFRVHSGIGSGAFELARFFNLKFLPLSHHYEIQATAAVTGKIEGGIGGVTASFRTAEIHYWNQLGMKFTKPISMASGGVIIGPGVAGSVDFDTSQMSGVAAPTVRFWHPSDFETRFTITKSGVDASGGVGPASGGVGYGFIQALAFHRGGNSLWFDTGNFSFSWSPISVSPKMPKKPFGGGASATTEIQEGKAMSDGETKVEVPPLDRHKTGRRIPLTTFPIHFKTGLSAITPSALSQINTLVSEVKAWNEVHPENDIHIWVIGHASRIWASHGKRSADELNEALSHQRADNVAGQIRNAFRAVGPGQASIMSVPEPIGPVRDPVPEEQVKGLGSKQAYLEGADPEDDYWKHRRVDIHVLYDEMGVEVYPPPYKPPAPTP